MLARLGWIGCSFASGCLLQVATQIHALHWLPDFPIYLFIAILAGGMALVATPVAVMRSSWPVWLCGGAFVLLAATHAVLAGMSSSSVLEWWRNVVFWPTLVAGLTTCFLISRSWLATSCATWSLGEAAATLLACWYAPSFGESQSLRAYQTALIGMLVTLVVCYPRLLPASPFPHRGWYLQGLILPALGMVLACWLLPDPEQAQRAMLILAGLRVAWLAMAEYYCDALPGCPLVSSDG